MAVAGADQKTFAAYRRTQSKPPPKKPRYVSLTRHGANPATHSRFAASARQSVEDRQ